MKRYMARLARSVADKLEPHEETAYNVEVEEARRRARARLRASRPMMPPWREPKGENDG